MTTFSIITADESGFGHAPTLPDFDALKDYRGLPWEPSPPSVDYTEISSTFYGTSAHGQRATFLDFSRPISKITGLLAASSEVSVGRLGGFSFMYTDGDTLFCGATARLEEPEAAFSMGLPSGPWREQQRAELPHVSDEEEAMTLASEFEGRGEKIQKVRVWAAAYLHGIQFVTETGRESPKWGKCGGSATLEVVGGEIIQGGGSAPMLEEVDEEWARGAAEVRMEVVGLKVVLGSRRYERGYSDVRPLAVEVMGRRKA